MNPTVFTRHILPGLQLQPYVRYFAVRTFETGDVIFPKTIIADYETVFSFFIQGKSLGVRTIAENGNVEVTGQGGPIECYFTGIQTCSKGDILFKGNATILCIHFAPTGLYHIFGISPRVVADTFGRLEPMLSAEINCLFEELLGLRGADEGIRVVENYLCQKLAKQKKQYRHPGIAPASEMLTRYRGLYPVRRLAYDLNMTLQTLETQFEEQVGIDPKLFCCLLRYNNAVTAKLYNPNRTWTDIAHTCGYYDQAHLIKEFKKFTGLPPKEFVSRVQPPVETFI